MRRPKKEIQLTSYDELLGLEESPEKSMNQVMEIELEKLYPFKNHPFHVNDDEKMAETVESIKTYGVLTPALEMCIRDRWNAILTKSVGDTDKKPTDKTPMWGLSSAGRASALQDVYKRQAQTSKKKRTIVLI